MVTSRFYSNSKLIIDFMGREDKNIMDWTQALTIFGGNIALFLWAVRQSRTDFLHMDKKLEENRRETYQLIKAIQEEIKDFHNRICRIEERNKNITN